jgi:hypothetical protein
VPLGPRLSARTLERVGRRGRHRRDVVLVDEDEDEGPCEDSALLCLWALASRHAPLSVWGDVVVTGQDGIQSGGGMRPRGGGKTVVGVDPEIHGVRHPVWRCPPA